MYTTKKCVAAAHALACALVLYDHEECVNCLSAQFIYESIHLSKGILPKSSKFDLEDLIRAFSLTSMRKSC